MKLSSTFVELPYFSLHYIRRTADMTTLCTTPSLATLFREGVFGQPGSSLQSRFARLLGALRTHLCMDFAFISEFALGQRIFRSVDSGQATSPIHVGESDPLEESYCQWVVDGRLPELIPDATQNVMALRIPATTELPVGAHLSVPIRLSNGQIYGTLCCFSYIPNHTLTERDLNLMRAMVEVVAYMIEEDRLDRQEKIKVEDKIKAVLSGDVLSIVYQPIYHFIQRRIVGFEALARFNTTPRHSPDQWFSEAAKVGLGIELELLAVELGLKGLDHLPEEIYISVNVAPETILHHSFSHAISRWPLQRVVLEVTEHAVTSKYADIAQALAFLKQHGLRLAVDDAGAGYASFRHILSLSPDIIKLDMSLTQNIDTDASRRALAIALIGFANATGSRIVAEGVEREEELVELRALGVSKAQGYYIGKPMTLERALEVAMLGSQLL
ncbi:sensor domain-containing phosphodiesterase [Rippkaea orientalis]|nr:EAL domain-containing protein [Rippkaea orientalis]